MIHNTALRVAYVGSLGYHGFVSVDPNTIPAQICSNCERLPGRRRCHTAPRQRLRTKATSLRARSISRWERRPNPSLGAGFFWYTEGNSSYNALQTEVTHRLSQGLQFRANYTWSKNLDMNSALTGAQASNQSQMILDRNDLRRDWGPSALNVTSQASISARYELPFGSGKRWLAGAGRMGRQADRWLAIERNCHFSLRAFPSRL